MNAPLLWREWREMSTTVWWCVAFTVLLAVNLRFVDEVIGVTVLGVILALFIGTASTVGDGSIRVREFLFSRPVRRDRLLRAKLVATLGTMNGMLLVVIAAIFLDLPAHFYGLAAETTFTDRLIHTDAPIWYPASLALANLVLLTVLVTRLLWGNRTVGVVIGIAEAFATGILLARLLSAWPDGFMALALLFFLVFLAVSVALAVLLSRGIRNLEITGGGA